MMINLMNSMITSSGLSSSLCVRVCVLFVLCLSPSLVLCMHIFIQIDIQTWL